MPPRSWDCFASGSSMRFGHPVLPFRHLDDHHDHDLPERERHQRDAPDKGFTSWGAVSLPLNFSLMSSPAIFSWSLIIP